MYSDKVKPEIPEVSIEGENAVIVITDKLLSFKGFVYQIKNISGVGFFTQSTRHKVSYIVILLCTFLYFSPYEEILYSALFVQPRRIGSVFTAGDIVNIVLLVVISFGVFERIVYRKIYYLQIEMNSGRSRLFISRDKFFLVRVVDRLRMVMENPDKEYNLVVDMRTQTIIDNPIMNIGSNVITNSLVHGNISSEAKNVKVDRTN